MPLSFKYDPFQLWSGLQEQCWALDSGVIPPRQVYNIVKVPLQEALSKMDELMISIGEKRVINALETCDANHKKAFFNGALFSALNILLWSILKDDFRIRESFKFAIVDIAKSRIVVWAVAKSSVTDTSVLVPNAEFEFEAVRSESPHRCNGLLGWPFCRSRHQGLTRHQTNNRELTRKDNSRENLIAVQRHQYHQGREPGHLKVSGKIKVRVQEGKFLQRGYHSYVEGLASNRQQFYEHILLEKLQTVRWIAVEQWQDGRKKGQVYQTSGEANKSIHVWQ